MSAGTVHQKASLILASGFSLGALVISSPEMVVCAGGALVGILISPDLDVDSGNISNKIIRKKVGWFGEKAWRWFWKPYATSFKHGRFASHFPVFSTFGRLAYIYFWFILLPHTLIFYLFNPHWNLIFVLVWYAKIFLYFPFLYGLVSSDTIHYFLDILTTTRKAK